MKIEILVTDKVLSILQQDGICYAKNNNPVSNYAYNVLKEITGYNGLFFGVLNNDYLKNQNELKMEMLRSGQENNTQLLTLEIPDNLVYYHDYYDFSDLIYYHDCEYNMDILDKILKVIKGKYITNFTQCVFPYIKKEWIIKINKII